MAPGGGVAAARASLRARHPGPEDERMTTRTQPVPTPRFGQILAASTSIAIERGDRHVGVEHMFLAIIRDRAAVPTQVLGRFTDLNQVDDELRVLMASEGYRTSAPPPERPRQK